MSVRKHPCILRDSKIHTKISKKNQICFHTLHYTHKPSSRERREVSLLDKLKGVPTCPIHYAHTQTNQHHITHTQKRNCQAGTPAPSRIRERKKIRKRKTDDRVSVRGFLRFRVREHRGWPLLRRNHEGPKISFFQIFLFSGPFFSIFFISGGHSGCGFLKILERKKRFIFFVSGPHTGGGLRCCGFLKNLESLAYYGLRRQRDRRVRLQH